MKVGVSGHRDREGADWDWVRAEIDVFIASDCAAGVSCLAPGADMIFAEAVLALGRRLIVMAPAAPPNGDNADRERQTALIAAASDVRRIAGATPDEAFFKAGKAVVDESDMMVFVWDGGPSRGVGGTADIVAYAAQRGKPGVVLDPIRRTVRDLSQALDRMD